MAQSGSAPALGEGVAGSSPATPTILRALRLKGTVGNRPEFALKIQNKTSITYYIISGC